MGKKLSILLLTIFIDLLGFGIVIPILPNYTKSLGHADYWVGIVAAIYSLMAFFATPIWGAVSDRYGRRPILLGTIVFGTVGYLMFSQATSIPILLLSRIIAGLGSGNISVAQAYISDITTPADRTKRLGLVGMAFGLGFIFGPPIGGFLMSNYGFAWVGYFASALCFLNLILAYILLPESLTEKNTKSKISILPIQDIKKAIAIPSRIRILIFNFLYVAAFSMFNITATLLWEEHYGLNDKERGYVFAFIGITTAIVQGGLIGTMKKYFTEKKLLMAGSIFMGISIALIPFVPIHLFIPLELLLLLIMSISNGSVGPSALSILSMGAGKQEQGAVMGLFQSAGSIARAFGPLLGGIIYGWHPTLPYLTAAVFMLLSLFIMMSVSMPKMAKEAD